jgi:hypothetical protein
LVFVIKIERERIDKTKKLGPDGKPLENYTYGKISLVDLAGSEKVERTLALMEHASDAEKESMKAEGTDEALFFYLFSFLRSFSLLFFCFPCFLFFFSSSVCSTLTLLANTHTRLSQVTPSTVR